MVNDRDLILKMVGDSTRDKRTYGLWRGGMARGVRDGGRDQIMHGLAGCSQSLFSKCTGKSPDGF